MATDEGEEKCQLLSGFKTYAVQIILGMVALSTLWYKRHVERPKRSLEIWGLDVSKQGIGAILGHFLNILIAMILPPLTDECVWYFMNFVYDCTLGTVVALGMLTLMQELAKACYFKDIMDSGDYGSPPSYRIWFIQLVLWLSIIVLTKSIVTCALVSSADSIGRFGNWLFIPLETHPFHELIVVMVICPCFLNVVQFWIQDSYLKRESSATPSSYNKYGHPKGLSFDESLQTSLLSEKV